MASQSLSPFQNSIFFQKTDIIKSIWINSWNTICPLNVCNVSNFVSTINMCLTNICYHIYFDQGFHLCTILSVSSNLFDVVVAVKVVNLLHTNWFILVKINMPKNSNSIGTSTVCTELPVYVFSSAVRKSDIPCWTAHSVGCDPAVKNANFAIFPDYQHLFCYFAPQPNVILIICLFHINLFSIQQGHLKYSTLGSLIQGGLNTWGKGGRNFLK